jgi:hypothetical protein
MSERYVDAIEREEFSFGEMRVATAINRSERQGAIECPGGEP